MRPQVCPVQRRAGGTLLIIMAKMWAGRTDGNTSSIADDFNSSIHFDSRMYREDITGSMAHAAMLGKQGIITEDEADALIVGLEGILSDLDNGVIEFDMSAEDIHMFVEQVLTERLGDLVEHVCSCKVADDGTLPAAVFVQVVVKHYEYLICRNIRSVAVNDSETVAVSVNRDTEVVLFLRNSAYK